MLELLVIIIIIGVLLYFLNAIPMDETVRTIVRIVAIIIVIVMVLRFFGIFDDPSFFSRRWRN